jgi:hypothetical protein
MALGMTFFVGFLVLWILGSRLHHVSYEATTTPTPSGVHTP